ncbi:MAG TPA: hypothetical protein DCS07_12180 [Bdellovibrionales bacterium]|nr:MAG: hypothetical protein A2Z97_02045 [Bdellovibrionales bacterium GWB1_52_6]OFZ03760.1 MAG: hypothetical protein A2X97_14505 [Bdellovibrionales bacterium GWA1_52_35]OFZ41781.1 MAG: hypothetical protein A2070_09275 [Bdellovibrionales bacterium GWC1_52_8]HAR43367.1 hypothetical protein [Bdellovibrionales bacterium]HCM38723.1 hypothetical protein [Bdellovibrionales bacterium]
MFFRAEHDQIDELLEKLELANPDQKPRILRTLGAAVISHFRVEETVLFQQLEFTPQYRKLIREISRAHSEAKSLLSALLDEKDLGRLSAQSENLIDLLLDIMDMEETILFPKLEAHLSSDELRMLARQLHYEPEIEEAA